MEALGGFLPPLTLLIKEAACEGAVAAASVCPALAVGAELALAQTQGEAHWLIQEQPFY